MGLSTSVPCELRLVKENGTEEHVSTHETFAEGWAAGQDAIDADRDNAYRLYAGGHSVAGFGLSRLTRRSLPKTNVETLDLLAGSLCPPAS